MKKFLLSILVLTTVVLISAKCGEPIPSGDVEAEVAMEFEFAGNVKASLNTLIPIEILVHEDLKVVQLYFNDSLISEWNTVKKTFSTELNTSSFGVGNYSLNLKGTDNDGNEYIDNRFIQVLSDIQPEVLRAEIINEYPHDPKSFTQGLEFYKGNLYEGTGDPGNQGNTVVAKVNLNTGSHDYSMGLQAGFFGEGITLLDDKLYQLTWQNQKCYVYDVNKELQLLSEFNYIGEGWGLCNDGKSLIMSNGSERIVFRDPTNFEIQKTIEVYNSNGKIINLNELEYYNGIIYANVWTTNIIVAIDPKTGKVLQQIDATDIVLSGRGTGEVLNGIAVKNDAFYLTGKNWKSLFKVKFVVPGA